VTRASQLRAVLALTVALSLGGSVAHAQLRRDTSGVWLPPTSYAASDDAYALSLDPAAMAFVDDWTVAYVHADAADSTGFGQRGDGLYGAIPLLFGVTLGASVESVRPAFAAPNGEAIGHTMLSLGLAYAPSRSLGIGAATRFLWGGALQNVFTLDLAATWRPSPHVAVSFVARDLSGPGYAGDCRPFGTIVACSVPRSFLLAVGIRPESTRALSFDLAGAIDEHGRVGARVMGELEVPYLGRAQAAFDVQNLGGSPVLGPIGVLSTQVDLRGTIGLAIDWGQMGVGGGAIVGNGFEGSPGWYVSARLDGRVRRGIPTGDVIAEVVMEGQGARSIVSTIGRLDRALHDPRVRGVLLRPLGSSIGMAYAQEIRLLVSQLEEAGRPVVCMLEDASGAELYMCAGASAIVADPAGGVRLYGPSFEVQHYGQLLRELGVRADFVRIGRYKSAIEEYQDDEMSDAAREERNVLMDELYGRLVHDLSDDLEVDEARVRTLIDQGPYVTSRAITAGLVHSSGDSHDLDDVLRQTMGGSYARERTTPVEARRGWGETPHVGVVVIDGEMTDGTNLDIPLLEIHTTGGRTAVEAIDRVAGDANVSAMIIRIDTPGGSVLAADQIVRAIQRARHHMPVIASMGSVAASGGYYVASACDEIWADPSTITGSIGVWFGKVDFEPIATRYGVHTEQISRSAHAGAESLWRPFSPDERVVLAQSVRDWYRSFIDRVAEGRGMRRSEVHAIAQGRVWTGDHAQEIGLVDRLGGFGSALQRARELGGLPDSAGFTTTPTRPSGLLDYVLQGTPFGTDLDETPHATATATDGGLADVLHTLTPEVLSALRIGYLMRAMESSEPLALMPMTVDVGM
jgi:protease-4